MNTTNTAAQLMSEAKFYESYARYLENEKRYETWEEAVERVINMHKEKYKDKMSSELQELLEFAQQVYDDKLILGAQRALQFGGEQLLNKNARLYNCTASYCDRPQFFNEALWLMLCGCFHPDTLIKTKNGDKKISEITIDDEVKSYDEENKTFVYIKPLMVHENQTQNTPKIKLTLENNKEVILTEDHEVLTKRGYVKAKDLLEDDDIIMDFENV